MKNIFITSSFSMSMFPLDSVGCGVYMQTMLVDEVEDLVEGQLAAGNTVISAVRHRALADILSKETRLVLAHNMEYFKISENDEIIFANYVGLRIPPKATKLPEGGRVDWYRIGLLK